MNPGDVENIPATIDFNALMTVWHENHVEPCFSYMPVVARGVTLIVCQGSTVVH